MRILLTTVVLLTALSFTSTLYANNAAYEQRRTDYINTALSNFAPNAITIQAYMNVPLNQAALDDMINAIPVKSTIDFELVKLVRIMFLDTGTYDSQIFPAIDTLPYWLRKNQWLYGYWSENHMIMWMSSDWLLHEKFGRAIDGDLDARLRHYLKLKIKYGFYEYFSSVYAPYCLSGLLNLADFAQDVEIKSLATQASVRLLRDLLKMTNDKGVFYPSAGRNYYSKYLTPYDQNHNSLIYLLTGFGKAPTEASHSGGFLATSSLFVDSIIDTWGPKLDELYSIGHPIDSFASIHKDMSQVDKVISQWSSGAYFHPKIAFESAVMIRDSNLWNHVDFTEFSQYRFFDAEDAPFLAEYASYASHSSVNCGQDVAIFRSNGVVLSSVQNFWKGKLGHQQFPCAATVGTTPVLIASGKVNKDWNKRSSANAQEHLPYIMQKKNVALLMYRQEVVPPVFTYKNPEVALYFKDSEFDEVRTDSLWILGRQNESYVAVRRACIDEIDSVRACPAPKGQSWVLVVGDSSMYSGFNGFHAAIQQSTFTENWSLDTTVTPWQHNYYAKVEVDTFTLEHTWSRDSVFVSGVNDVQAVRLNAYPNPATNEVNITLADFENETVNIKLLNVLGQVVFSKEVKTGGNSVETISTNHLDGMHFLIVEGRQKKGIQKLLFSQNR